MKKLIINADDLGISKEVNSSIEDCIKKGVVSSSTLMANAPAFDDGVRIAKQYSRVSVGVHLNIIQFAPLTNSDLFKRHGIVGDDGSFVEGAIFCVPIDEELKEAIFEEWDAQITKIEATGLIPTHCDSHQHTHTIDALQDVLCRVMDKHGIRKVRRKLIPSIILMIRSRRRPAVRFDKSKAMMPIKHNVVYRRLRLFWVIYSCYNWNRRMKQRYLLTDSFFAFNSFYYDRKYLKLGGKKAIVELMCHPGLVEFREETEYLLMSDSWQTKKDVIVSYNDLV